MNRTVRIAVFFVLVMALYWATFGLLSASSPNTAAQVDPPPPPTDPTPTPTIAEAARQYYDKGFEQAFGRAEPDYVSALANFDKAIELDPTVAAYYADRGWVRYLSNRPEEGIADFDKAIELDPSVADHYVSRGQIKSVLGRYEEAIADYDKAIELAPSVASYHQFRGNANHLLGRNEDAVVDLDKAIELDPTAAFYYADRGFYKTLLGRHEAAIVDYDKAIELAPSVASYYMSRGEIRSWLDRHEEAIADFDKAIELDPSVYWYYAVRGREKLELGRHEEAIADYDKAIELDPSRGWLYSGRGEAKLKFGRHEEAIADYDKAIELDPSRWDFYDRRGKAMLQLGRHEEAIADFDKAIELIPQASPSLYSNRGAARAALGRKQAAIEDYRTALKLLQESSYNDELKTSLKEEFEEALRELGAGPAPIPAAPVLTATVTDDAVTIRWEAVENAVHYNLWAKEWQQEWQLIGSELTDAHFTRLATPQGFFWYIVQAVNADGEAGDWSRSVYVSLPGGKPTKPVVHTPVADDYVYSEESDAWVVYLDWYDAHTTYFVMWAWAEETGWFKLADDFQGVDTESTTFVVEVREKGHNLKRGVVYWVVVSISYQSGLWSDWSEPVSITFPPE